MATGQSAKIELLTQDGKRIDITDSARPIELTQEWTPTEAPINLPSVTITVTLKRRGGLSLLWHTTKTIPLHYELFRASGINRRLALELACRLAWSGLRGGMYE